MEERVKSKAREPTKDSANAELERELTDSFPASDPPSITQPNVKPGAPDHGEIKRVITGTSPAKG
jgi:hypothetical protein